MGLLEKAKLRGKSDSEKKLYFEIRVLELQTERKNLESKIARIDREIKDAQAKIKLLEAVNN